MISSPSPIANYVVSGSPHRVRAARPAWGTPSGEAPPRAPETLRRGEQGPHADQVVRRSGEGDDPIDQFTAAVSQLTQPADRLHPTEDLLDQLSFLLTDRVAHLAGRPAVDRRVLLLLGDMRCHAECADAFHKAGHVEALVAAGANKRLGAEAGARIAEDLSPDALSLYTELAVAGNDRDGDIDEVAAEIFTRVRLFSLERDIKTRRNNLQDVNPVEDPALHDQLFTELVRLEAQRRDLHKQLRRETEEVEA